MDEKNVASPVLLSDELVLPTIGHIGGRVVLPGSKSISNRALLLAALAQGTTKLDNLLYSDDIRHMMTALRLLGIDCQLAEDKRSCQVTGGDSQFTFDKAVELFLGNAGTAMRPLAAALAVVAQPQYPVTLTGEPRMLERPIRHLVDALIQGGADIRYQGKKGFPPLQIKGGFQGGEIALNGSVSSQFLTALLLAAPLAPKETYIVVKGDLVSQPYAEMTVQMMEQFGMLIQHDPEFRHFFIRGGQNYYAPGYFWVEGDASSASYFLAAAAIKGGEIRVDGVGKKSIQGDKQFGRVLAKMGAKVYYGDNYIECVGGYPLHGIDVDVNAIPDAAMTLATTALFAKGTTTLRNIGNWRVKETDRLTAMATELRKVGATVEEGQDYISITPPVHWQHARINTYNDHRMAMCFSLVALSAVGVTILDPTCVSKTFPDYFERLAQICG